MAVSNLQGCVGHQAKGETNIHAVKEIFKDKAEDASMLHNTSVKSP